MSENVWKKLSDKYVPQDPVQLMASSGDFGINCLWSWLPFALNMNVGTFFLALVLSLGCFGISFAIPTLGQSVAKAGGFLSKLVLTLAVFCTIVISTAALNRAMNVITADFSSADLDLWFMVIPGEAMTTYTMIFLAVVLAIINALRPFMMVLSEHTVGKTNLRSVA